MRLINETIHIQDIREKELQYVKEKYPDYWEVIDIEVRMAFTTRFRILLGINEKVNRSKARLSKR